MVEVVDHGGRSVGLEVNMEGGQPLLPAHGKVLGGTFSIQTLNGHLEDLDK